MNKIALTLLGIGGALIGTAQISQAAAYASAVLADNPVAYWRMDADASDSSGNGHNGAVDGASGSVVFGSTSLVPGEAGNGSVALFGGGADARRILVPGFTKVSQANGYTAEYWTSITAYPGACCDSLVSDGEAGGDFFMMNYLIGPGQGTDGAVRPHFGFGGVVSITTNANPLALNTPTHVVTTWDPGANTGNVYFNGTLVLTQSGINGDINNPAGSADNAIFIGRDNREARPSNFIIDEVALYDYALTPAQIQNHYNLGIVPEPSSTALLGIAFLSALARRRRR